ncbi:probable multidrug resistance-associated protein lethal(2)03659 [Schistocerca gregaria]|uniref:probable multidrug resistance-associated protein lethal(2)03659 n=1 Tax=Schistocerca gregaria TaxID=7010 RepID=UPI00211DC5A8|nr:probable multidrug resistance-associated protein lethal(2)03659 [Schistocerca gregaria]XP_049853485.1 probable multidrug resistance-associated protein lethal(2)03659 [Schistocerca gregaria]
MNEKEDITATPHPRSSANLLSALTFWWTLRIFKTGLKRDIEIEDLYAPLKEHKSSLLGERFERLWKQECRRAVKNKRSPSYLRVILSAYGWKYMMYGCILAALELIVRVAQPLFLGFLLQYFSPGSTMPILEAYLYATAVILCSLITATVTHPFAMAMYHLALKMRVASCSLLYRKALKLNENALSGTATGQVVNLMANDVQRFDMIFILGHYLWLGPIETAIITYFIWTKIGVAAFGGTICVLLFIPLQGYLGKLSSRFRYKTAICTDERVRTMNEIISGIQVIKMYAWEKSFTRLIAATRKKEMNAIRIMQYIRAVTLSMGMFVTRLSTFFSIIIFVILGENVTPDKVFVVSAYYIIMKQAMSDSFPRAVTALAEGLISGKRIENFLNNGEIKPVNLGNIHKRSIVHTKTEKGYAEKETPCIKLIDVTAKWESSAEDTLKNVTLKVVPGKLFAIIGPVGAGKSSLLQTILGELPATSGTLAISGKVSYASQGPWLFASTIRQNILFGEPYDRERYWQVIKACALEVDFDSFPHRDKTLVGDRGIMLSGGQKARVNLARAVYRKADIYLLDDPLSAVDPHVARNLFDQCITGLLKNSICILVTHQIQFLHHVDEIIILQDGVVQAKGSYSELQVSGLDFTKLMNSEIQDKSAEEDSRPEDEIEKQDSIERMVSVEEVSAPQQEAELRTSGGVRNSVYLSYFSSGGNYCLQLFVAVAFILTPVVVLGGDYWLSYWTNSEEVIQTLYNESSSTYYSSINTSLTAYGWIPDTTTSVYVYTAVMVATVVIAIVRSVSFFILCTRASMRLHNQMFIGVTQTAMHFFNNNPAGRILNRFSKDIGNVDETLPLTMIDSFQIILLLIGTVITVAVINFWTLIPTVVLIGVFWVIRKIFLSASRSLKRLESITRSPVFCHANETLQGLPTIRAFGAQKFLEKEFDHIQDVNSSAFYIFTAISRAFGLWLDFVCVAYLAVVTYSFLVLGQDVFGGSVGLAITQSLNLIRMFQWGIRQSAELINQMTGVERVLEFAGLKPEPSLESPSGRMPPSNWPATGQIKFHHVFLKYSENSPPVLKDLNFTIMPQEKVGIVGRTGAGKSSIIAALFRLANIEGEIMIDNIDTGTIGLHDFRPKISVIPQEPVLFSGSLRKNLDPFDEFPDAEIWQALGAVELKDVVNETPAGLNFQVSEGGSNFSVGQRQLICLARAVIRKNKILVLDEATANVDPATDSLIQQTVHERFTDCTVLTIAHRLHTIIDSDKVLVMDNGNLKEFDHPHILLSDKNSIFHSMVQQAGKVVSEELKNIAEESYRNRMHEKSS